MYRLIIEDDEGRTTIVPLIRNQINIGREEGNTIRLTERNVSRRHAKLLVKDGQIMIEDLKSYNGVWVNGSRISGKASLKPGDLLEIGDYHLSVQGETAETDPKSRPSVPTHQEDEDLTPPLGLPAIQEQEPDIVEIVAPPEPAVLLLLNTSKQGSIFDVEWPAVMIGRTEENEIAIDHASVSRHHAKIVCEDGVYKLYDLDSANGVQVNGQPFKSCDLRWGDIIEVGQIRFRFCAADEDLSRFTPASSVTATTGASSPSSSINTFLIVALVLVVVGGGGIFAFLQNSKNSKPAPLVPRDAGQNPLARTVSPALTPEQQKEKEKEQQFKLAEDLFVQESYEKAKEVLQKLRQEWPSWKKAQELQQQCDFEIKNYRLLQESVELQAEGKVYVAYQRLMAVDKQSRYFARAEHAKQTLISQAVEEVLQKVRQSIADKRYFEAVQHNSKALDLMPQNEEAKKLHKQLEELTDPKSRTTPVPPRITPPERTPTQGGSEPPSRETQPPSRETQPPSREAQPPSREAQPPSRESGPARPTPERKAPTPRTKSTSVLGRCETKFAAKQYVTAQKCFQNVLRRKGDDEPRTHLFLGHIAKIRGNCLHADISKRKPMVCLEARYHYNQFLRLRPNSPDAQALRQELKLSPTP